VVSIDLANLASKSTLPIDSSITNKEVNYIIFFHFLYITFYLSTLARWEVVFPTLVFPNPKPVLFGYFLPPETRFFSTTKRRYFKNPGIAVAFKYQ